MYGPCPGVLRQGCRGRVGLVLLEALHRQGRTGGHGSKGGPNGSHTVLIERGGDDPCPYGGLPGCLAGLRRIGRPYRNFLGSLRVG